MDKNLEIITGKKEIIRNKDKFDLTIDQHLAKEWNADIGMPMCVYTIKRMIVQIRRGEETDHNKFLDYLENYKSIIIPNLNYRWTLSVIDTLADGPKGERKINASWLSAFYKQSMITDSLFLHLTNWEINHNNILNKMPLRPDPHNPKVQIYADPKPIPRLKGQVTNTNMNTDVLPNMAHRLNNAIGDDELLKDLHKHLSLIYNESDTLIGLWTKLKHEG